MWCDYYTARITLFGTCRSCLHLSLSEARYALYIFALLLAALGLFDGMMMALDWLAAQ